MRSALLLLLLAATPLAQISSGGIPRKLGPSARVPIVLVAPPDVAQLRAEDEARGHRPYRYGAPLEVTLAAETHGSWETEPDGSLVWRVQIHSPGALSLGLELEHFELPEGGRLFVYDPAGEVVLGAFTSANHLPNGMLAVQPLPGDRLILEYGQGPDTASTPKIAIGRVIHDYRGVFAHLSDSPQAFGGGCQQDAVCPDAALYQDIKRAVVMLLTGGGQCSGVMLNNSAEDGTPLLYTADHCGDLVNTVAVFGYERPLCGSGIASQTNTVSGATLLSDSPLFDGQIYELSAAPPESYEPFYAGWDKRGNPDGPTQNFSHPGAQPKKFAFDESDPVQDGRFWNAHWEIGLIQGGSSGSPLFSGEQRVIGTACCVNNFSCGQQVTSFGRFGGFWNQMDLAPFLDPLGSGINHIDGFDPYLPIAIPYNGTGINPHAYTSTTRPGVGTLWRSEIEASSHPGATFSAIFGHGAAASYLLLLGELLIEPTSPQHFVSVAAVAGGLSDHNNMIPNDVGLVGFRSFTQGFLVGGGTTQATNGLQLRLR